MPFLQEVQGQVIAGVIVLLIGWLAGLIWNARSAKRKIESAPYRYARELGRQIDRAVAEGPRQAMINARAIVRIRDSLRDSLVSLSSLLNSEIDTLSTQIGVGVRYEQMPQRSRPASATDEDVFRTLLVLQKVWESKAPQIVFQIRKILVELGLLGGDYHGGSDPEPPTGQGARRTPTPPEPSSTPVASTNFGSIPASAPAPPPSNWNPPPPPPPPPKRMTASG